MTGLVWLKLAALLSLALLLPSAAWAASVEEATILVLHPSDATLDTDETLTRIQGELAADGFQVRALAYSGQAQRDALVRLATEHAEAAALVGLFSQPENGSAELWVIDHVAGRVVTTRVEVTAPTVSEGEAMAPEVLARRAVEVLRATLLERRVVPHPAPAPRPERPRPTQPTARRQPRWGAELGVLAFGYEGADRWGVAPLLRLRTALSGQVGIRLSASAFGVPPVVREVEGRAEVAHSSAILELLAALPVSGPVRPFSTIGVGVSHVAVSAKAADSYIADERDQWSLAFGGGVGVSLSLGQRFALSLDASALVDAPHPVVRFVGREVASIGQPTFRGALTVVGWL